MKEIIIWSIVFITVICTLVIGSMKVMKQISDRLEEVSTTQTMERSKG